jgi:rubrerythrin
MGYYARCPNCGNTREGTAIYRCEQCRSLFCASCGALGLSDHLRDFLTADAFASNAKCPFCDQRRVKSVGRIGEKGLLSFF